MKPFQSMSLAPREAEPEETKAASTGEERVFLIEDGDVVESGPSYQSGC